MEPPRDRFERSIPAQEEKMKELLVNFKAEMMGKFEEQEERNFFGGLYDRQIVKFYIEERIS